MSAERISLVSEPADVYRSFADTFLSQLREHQDSTRTLNVILPVGPTSQYELIAEAANAEGLTFANCRVILMDEYLDWHGRPIPRTSPLSFQGQFETFLSRIDEHLRLKREHWVIPDPFDIARVDKFIDRHGPIDRCYGGIGVHGHIAFNEPPVTRYGQVSLEEFRESGTRVVALAPETITINALRGNHGRFSDFPNMAVTIGMKHILESKSIRLYADGGSRQHEALRQFAFGTPTVLYPITLLISHPDVRIIVDENTGAGLSL